MGAETIVLIDWAMAHTHRRLVERGADVPVSQDLTLTEAHNLAHRAEDHLLADVPRLTAATIHVSPADAHEPSPEFP
jgi:divalent metal cation (Fe/Co/Zn/Cd) transporter